MVVFLILNYFENTMDAVNFLGGMGKFVSKGSKVSILPNSLRKTPGTHVQQNILLAVIDMCYNSGAKEIIFIKDVVAGYWDESSLSNDHREMIKNIKVPASEFIVKPIPDGKKLKEAHIDKAVFESDVFINVSIAKHHVGTNCSGILKNLMGASSHNPTNRFMHFGNTPNTEDWYENVDFLSQCIADLNTLKQPDLCIADAVEFLISNGPFGPGETNRKDTVTAGTNAVSTDAYCTRFLNLTPDKVPYIGKANESDLGEMDMNKVSIKEVTS
jgi:uncharacterized protein (DUF362 family)